MQTVSINSRHLHLNWTSALGITALFICGLPLFMGPKVAVSRPGVCYSLVISLTSKQMKGLELISSGTFAFEISESEELSLLVKQAIVRLQNKTNPSRECGQINGSNGLVSAITTKSPSDTNMMNNQRILSLVKKEKSFTTFGQIKNTLRGVQPLEWSINLYKSGF